jgi:dienelactone hydrolase
MAKRKTDIPDNVMRPLAVGVFVIMVITVVVLQIFLRNGEWEEIRANSRPDSFNNILNDYLPDEEAVLSALQPGVSEGVLESEEFQFTGRNSLQTTAYVSKPEGAGPFPAIILVHDAPASQRSAQRLSVTVGERLSQEQNAIVISVDWQEGTAAQNDLSDVVSSVDWISRLQEQQGEETYVLGIGYGGYLAFLAANEIDANGVVSVAGYHDPGAVYAAIEQEGTNKKEADVSERGQQFLTSMGCNTAANPQACLEQLSAEDALRTDIPALLVHNAKDSIVPASQLTVLEELLGSAAETELLELESDQHDTLASATTPGFEETMESIQEWLDDQLNSTPTNTTVEVVVPDPPQGESTEEKQERTPIKIEVDPDVLLENATEQSDS